MPKYIEFETLKKKINEAQAEKEKFPFNGSLYETGYHNGLTMALTLAMYSAAADVAPVRNGRWISLTDCANAGVYCSECKKKVWKEDYAPCNRKNKLRSMFCPNCGARMDGDAKP